MPRLHRVTAGRLFPQQNLTWVAAAGLCFLGYININMDANATLDTHSVQE